MKRQLLFAIVVLILFSLKALSLDDETSNTDKINLRSRSILPGQGIDKELENQLDNSDNKILVLINFNKLPDNLKKKELSELGLFEATGGDARSACINFSNLDNYNSKQGELRVIDNATNTSVPFEVISNTSDSVCLIPLLNLSANGNDSFYLYWNNSNAPNITFTTDFASVSPSSLQVANHEFSFKGSILSGLDNYSFGRNLDGQEFWNGITNDNGAGTALARNTGSCNIKDINGSVVKWVNCSNSGVGMLCVFAAFNNFTRCTFSGFNTNVDDGMYVTCGDGSSSDSSIHFRGNDGVMLTGHGESGMVRDSAGILGCGKDAYSTKAFMYWNASWANMYTRANSTASYTRNGVGADPQITVATTSFHGNYRWNLNSVNVYVGITGNSSDAVRETWAWLENKPIITFGQNETFSTSPTYANEQEGRTAIEAGINSSVLGSSVSRYTEQQIYARNLSNAQVIGRFDKVAASGNQRWAFNYITGSDTNINMFNITPVLYILEMNDLSAEQITDTVGKLINSTKQ